MNFNKLSDKEIQIYNKYTERFSRELSELVKDLRREFKRDIIIDIEYNMSKGTQRFEIKENEDEEV